MQDTNYKLRAWMGANRVSGARMAYLMGMPYDTFKTKFAGKSEWKLSEVITIMKVTGSKFDEIF